MIINKNGRTYSLRTDDEEIKLLKKELSNLDKEEREVLEVMLKELEGEREADGQNLLEKIGQLEYKRTPVDMRTFVTDRYFLGNTCDTLYPKLLDSLVELFEGGYQECILTGGIGIGKTFAGSIGICRILYELSCMVDPHRSFGLAAGSNISVVAFSVTEQLAIKVAFENIATKIEASPYFREHFPFEKTKKELRFPSSIWVAARATTDSGALGLNCISALIDECLHGESLIILEDGTEERVDVLCSANQSFRIHTFDFVANKAVGADAFVKKSTNQECFEIVLDDGTSIKASANHPIAVEVDGVLQFATVDQIKTGDKVVKYAEMGGKSPAEAGRRVPVSAVDRGTQEEAIGRCEAPDRERRTPEASSWEGRLSERDRQTHRRNKLLRGARLGIRDLGRELTVGRVVSKRSVGVFTTYDISVPGYEVYVASGVLVHNTNFMPKVTGAKANDPRFANSDRADTIYNSIKRRMKSRFERHGKLPGVLFILSSKQSQEDFTARRINESKDDPSIFVRDYCLSGDTKISLVDGSVLTLKELADKYQGSEERFLVYSIDRKNNRIGVGRAHHPRLTSSREKVLRVVLDNGRIVEATAWHPFLLSTGEYKKVEALEVGDSIASREQEIRVVRIEDGEEIPVYDLTVEEYENFVLDAGIFVKNSLWDVKPEVYKSTTFAVLVGNEQIPSRILLPEDAELFRKHLPEGCVLIDVPENFRVDFESDLEKSIRDLAGIATLSVSPFIQRREKIAEAVDNSRQHPFSVMEYDSTTGGMFKWDQMVHRTTTRKYGRRVEGLVPFINPSEVRHVHVDPSFRKDCLGFTMAHVGGWVDVIRRDPNDLSRTFKERAPIYIVDFMLRVLPPAGGEIIFGDIRRLIYDLAEHGYTITTVSMDSFQSADGLQQLRQKGYNALDISVDTSPEPYDNLKTALYEGRVQFYKYEPLLKELRTIEQRWNALKKRKIDHPPKGSKDVADSLAGCLWTLSQGAASAHPLPPMMAQSVKPSDEAWFEEQRHAALGGQRGAAKNVSLSDYDMFPPFLTSSSDPDDPDPWGSGNRGGY